MNKLFKHFLMAFSSVVLAFSVVSCSDDDDKNIDEDDILYYEILENYVNTTIVPTYKNMAEAALKMRTVNNALKNNPSDENMKKASAAWMDMRIWWEMNEAFLFGPVGEDAYDIDAHIDSWPLELKAIQDRIVLENGDITGREAWLLEPEEIGFHVAEYLLYREGKSRPVASLTDAELKYLTAVTDAMVWDCILAYVAWIGLDNVTSEMKEVFNENPDVVDHYESRPNFRNFGTKFKAGTAYPSLAATVSEIAAGCETIADEVGATKIEQPYETQKTEEVESWYSWHSIDDYSNNIESIKNAYLGGTNSGTRTRVSLSTYIEKVDPGLDEEVKGKIEECITKIKAMGTGGFSFYEVVRDQKNKREVDEAVDACLDLADLFKKVARVIE